MSKQTAFKITVQIRADHTIQLPDDVPIGQAEVIVFVAEEPKAVVRLTERKQEPGLSPIGLFEDCPEIVDEMMEHVRQMRAASRIGDIPK
jgi:hypothetical protein